MSELTSPGLEKLKELINAAVRQKAEAAVKLKKAQNTLHWADFKLGVAKAFIVRLLLGRAVPGLHKAVIEKTEERDACQAVHDAAHININFAFDRETWKTWTGVVESFGRLCGSIKIWDVTASYYTNMAAERTDAVTSISRVPVRFDTVSTDVVSTKWPALRFWNTNGRHVHVYPGFAMMRDRSGDFALVDLLELAICCTYTIFHEEEGVPQDAEVCGQTWKKANKDGGPDRRFSHNYRIPITRYGRIDMTSPTGINERYMISSCEGVAAFGNCYEAHVRALRTMSKSGQQADLALPAPGDDDALDLTKDSIVQPGPVVMSAPPLRRLVVDMAAVAAIVVGGWYYSQTYGIGFASPKPPTIDDYRSPAPSPAPAQTPASVAQTSAPVSQTVIIKVRSANVRSSPSAAAAVVGTLPSGKVVSVFGISGDWLRVGDKEPVGWVHKSVVTN